MLTFKKGITLVESLVIVSILAVLSSIAYTQYQIYVRQGRQLEAKSNLSVVYQKQISYLSSELQFSPSLRTIGAVPKGRIRYNVGTDWEKEDGSEMMNHAESRLHRGDPGTICPCHNDEKGTNIPSNMECWADPHPEGTQACNEYLYKACFGGETRRPGRGMIHQLERTKNFTNGTFAINIPAKGFPLTGNKFEYYAVGCTNSQMRNTRGLDIWSINHKKSLQNIKQGLHKNR